MKKCYCCQIIKELTEFHKNKSKIDGLNCTCKQCKSLYHKGFKKGKRPSILKNNQITCPQCKKTLDTNNFFKAKSATGFTSYCKKCVVKSNFKQYQKNRKSYYCIICNQLLERYSRYCKDCKVIHKKKHRSEYEAKRRKNLEYKLKSNISRRIWDFVKNKKKSTLKVLSYTMQELKDHLEKQFEPWMNWENHGNYKKSNWKDDDSSTWTWHIDHIIPQSKLPYDSMEHPNFKKCWSLENLRPLSAKQNLIEGNRR